MSEREHRPHDWQEGNLVPVYIARSPAVDGKRSDVSLADLKAVDSNGAAFLVRSKTSEGDALYYTSLPRAINQLQGHPPYLAMVLEMMTDEEFEAYADSLPDLPDQTVL